MGPRAGLDRCGKSRPTGIRSRTVQPVAIRYTDYATRLTKDMATHYFNPLNTDLSECYVVGETQKTNCVVKIQSFFFVIELVDRFCYNPTTPV